MQILLSAVSGAMERTGIFSPPRFVGWRGENIHTRTKLMQGGFLVLNIHSFGIWRSEETRRPVPADGWVQVPGTVFPGLVPARWPSGAPTEKQALPITTDLPGGSQVPASSILVILRCPVPRPQKAFLFLFCVGFAQVNLEQD